MLCDALMKSLRARDGKKFLVDHGRYEEPQKTAIASRVFDYVLTSHTRKRRDERRGKPRIINPGSLFTENDSSIAVLDVEHDSLEFITI